MIWQRATLIYALLSFQKHESTIIHQLLLHSTITAWSKDLTLPWHTIPSPVATVLQVPHLLIESSFSSKIQCLHIKFRSKPYRREHTQRYQRETIMGICLSHYFNSPQHTFLVQLWALLTFFIPRNFESQANELSTNQQKAGILKTNWEVQSVMHPPSTNQLSCCQQTVML